MQYRAWEQETPWGKRRMVQSAHLHLLVSLLKGNYEAVHNQLKDRAFDFNRFKDPLAKHQLSGYVYSIVADSPARQAFPPVLIDHLRSSYARQRTKNEQMLREVKLLSSTFSVANQEFILLKGPYLAKRFYGSIDRRVFWDIDILARRKDLTRAMQLLARNGFKRQSRILLHQVLTTYFTHALEFAKPGVIVDLHWALKNRPSYNFNYKDIWETRQESRLDGIVVHVLSDHYALAFTLISIFNDIEMGKIRLKSFIDLYMITKAIDHTVDWNQFFERRKEEKIYKISLNVLGLFLKLFDRRPEFPNLALAIDLRNGLLEQNGAETIGRLMTHSRAGLTHRAWAARLYQGSRLRFLLWWMVSMPFRRAAFRSGKSSRLKRDLQGLKRSIGLER